MKESDKKAEATLNALDGIKTAKAPNDFEQKLFERLKFVPEWIRWFRYSAAALLIFGLINVFTIFSISSEEYPAGENDYMEDNLLPETSYPTLTISEE